jgi:tetratricopeptide (TPR) repeat protein
VADLILTASEYQGLGRWRWVLQAGDRVLASHDARLDDRDWQFGAFADLPGYLHLHAAPDRRLEHEAEIIAQVGAWAGVTVFGQVADALLAEAETGPVEVSVVVPNDPAEVRQIAYLPLQLAHAGGEPLAVQGITLVMRTSRTGPDDDKAEVGARLRVLALFSAPDGGRPLNLRRERVALTGLLGDIVRRSGRAVDLRVLQYGATRDLLREVLAEAEGWDLVHVSGHGQPGELLLETEAGAQDQVTGRQLADLLHAARKRLKLVTISACSSAALTAEQQLRLLDIPVPGGAEGRPAGLEANQPLDEALAYDLARRLDCAVLAMRYPVADYFAANLAERVYRLMIGEGQPLPRALGIALPEVVASGPALWCPPLSVATPVLIGDRAANLVMTAPLGNRMVSGGPGDSSLAGFPDPPDRFVGRVALMARANTALAPRSGTPGVVLHGMPGGGKTACALELAYAHQDAFEAFVWYKAPDEDHDTDPALTAFALTLEHALPGVRLVHLLDDDAGLAGFWPVLTEVCERRRVMFVIDNAESLLTGPGRWRDRRWAAAIAALTRHSGPSRLLLTSRVRPEGLPPRVRTEQVDVLSLSEAVLLARELPRLRALMDGKAAGMAAAAARTLARRVLEHAQGHPKLLELADGRADDPPALQAMLDAIGDTWQANGGLPEGFFATGASPASGEDYRQVLAAWTHKAVAQLPDAVRDMFMFLCCLEEADRVSTVADSVWPEVRGRLGRPSRGSDVGSLYQPLRHEALIAVHREPDAAAMTFGIHPVVAAAGRDAAGDRFQAAVDARTSSYWEGVSLAAARAETGKGAGRDIVTAGLRAAPYLLRLSQWDSALALLEESLARDHSRRTLAAALPRLRAIADGLRGQPNEPAAIGTLARVQRSMNPAAAEQQLMSVLATAISRARYDTAFVAAADLSEFLRESGRLDEALSYAGQSASYAERAQLGPWTRIAAQRNRLLILLEQGRAEQVLHEVGDLTSQTRQLAGEDPGGHEVIQPWMVEHTVIDTGRAAALRLGRWSEALAYNAANLDAMQRRGAPDAEIARTRFGDYGPLLNLGRTDEALALLQECRRAAEHDHDIEMLAVIFGALAETEDAQGHLQVATERCQDSLRFLYRAGLPGDIAGGHVRLGNYLGRGGRSHADAVTQFLAAALMRTLTGIGQADDPVAAAAAHLRAAKAEEEIIPADAAALCGRADKLPGVGLGRLVARISSDQVTVEHAYRDIVQRVRALAAHAPGATPLITLVQWDPPIAAILAATQGNAAAGEMAQAFLGALAQAGRPALARTLHQIFEGKRDVGDLTSGLDDADTAVVRHALDALTGRIEIPGALWSATPIAGALVDLVAACRGAPAAPARARGHLTTMAAHPGWSDLARVLERILAGERGDQLIADLTNPMHQAVVTLVLAEIEDARPAMSPE